MSTKVKWLSRVETISLELGFQDHPCKDQNNDSDSLDLKGALNLETVEDIIDLGANLTPGRAERCDSEANRYG